MSKYLVTKSIQTWDCNKWLIYTLDDAGKYYVEENRNGYSVETLEKYKLIENKNAFLFDNIEDAKLHLAIIIHNSRPTYYRSMTIDTVYNDSSFKCGCGLYITPHQDDWHDDGTPPQDKIFSDICVCGKVHKFQQKVEIITNVSVVRI